MTPYAKDQDAPSVSAVLGRTLAAVDPLLRTAVRSLPGGVRAVAEYHLGWRDRTGAPAASRPGKAIRPALVLAAARAVGGREEDAFAAAAATELVHNFTLLHDDVIDRDPLRRHRATAWTVFGSAEAIVAGDAMAALAVRLVADRPEAVTRLSDCVVELCEGQYEDCSFERRTAVGLGEAMAMAEAKTGALLGTACALGGLYGGAPPPVTAALDAFGRGIGISFQLIDDLLGIWGDPEITGKPVGADLAARKKSMPVVAALVSDTGAAAELAALYAGSAPLGPAGIARATELVEQAGGRDWARREASVRAVAALDRLAGAVPDPAATAELVALCELITRRKH
ncbi:polyprenyl synthetase family protein [Streptomyces sp. NBC_01408]|uniref:polyprenyl synthetase family protein n=1 Tax=Streptomyces sp. NBC_01408 TaxID=2903855 RepID=UPI002257376F|nr:polyprenyl synthetase family protein [Streptomyces sp. NBC_01408]MCX4695877.1 polyprenyl synthetase family protein [Streptomyces sp. NBC_01408]